jgi:hypothetical protein
VPLPTLQSHILCLGLIETHKKLQALNCAGFAVFGGDGGVLCFRVYCGSFEVEKSVDRVKLSVLVSF